MKHPVVTVKPHDTIAHARQIMEERRLNQLPVVVNGGLVGIITDRDLRDAFPSVFEGPPRRGRRRAAAADPDAIMVEEVMTANVLTLDPESSVEEAARLMRAQRIGAVPIVGHHRVVGIVTRSDVLEAFLTLAEAQTRAAS